MEYILYPNDNSHIMIISMSQQNIYKHGYDITYFPETLNDGSLNSKAFPNHFRKAGYKIDPLINIASLWTGIILICKTILKSLCPTSAQSFLSFVFFKIIHIEKKVIIK